MGNVVRAIDVEETYLAHRMRGEYPFHLVDKIKECGFGSLEDYFSAKSEYTFNQLSFNYVVEPMPNGVSEIFKMIQTGQAGVLFVDWENTFVVAGNTGIETLNQEYCKNNNITIFPLHTGGGTIVGSTGDFSFGVCCPVGVVDSAFILNKTKDILQKHTDKEITVKGNDICIDGNKISGTAAYQSNGVLMTILHFSFTDHSKLISEICVKATSKPVTYVDFVTRDVFKQEVAEWLQVHSI